MKPGKMFAPIFLILFAFVNDARAQQAELNIHYILPENPDLLMDARRLEASALSQRNIEIQACANGNNSRLCEQNAEIAFRLRILAIPQARMALTYNLRGDDQTYYVLDLTAHEAVNPNLDRNFHHLSPGLYYPLGTWIERDNCGSNSSPKVRDFISAVCSLIQRGEDSSSGLWWLIRRSKDDGASPSLRTVSFLLDHGGDVDHKSSNDTTILTFAVHSGFSDLAKLLVERGADVNSQNKDGYSALHVASIQDSLALVKLLIKNGADVNARDADGTTPLGWAARYGSLKLVRHLVENGAEVDVIQDNFAYPRTALFYAANAGRADIAKYLLDKGAQADGKASAFTPLMAAAEQGFVEVVLLLLEHGASVDKVSLGGYGESAIQMAKKNGHTKVVEILRKHGAKE